MNVTQVFSERRYKAGYIVRDEEWQHDDLIPVRMKAAYTPGGDYIGDPKEARVLCKDRGIAPEKRSPDSAVCSIGFCETEQKWYGWSHRAICGFGVGDVVKDGDCTATSGLTDEWLAEHPEDDHSLPVGFQAKTLDDAKRMAVAFASFVS